MESPISTVKRLAGNRGAERALYFLATGEKKEKKNLYIYVDTSLCIKKKVTEH